MEPFVSGRTPSLLLVSDPLLANPGTALVIFRFLDRLPHDPQRFLQKRSGLLTVRPFESHGVNLDFASGPDDDLDGSVHDTPMSTSLMDPFCCWRRRTDSPFFLASIVALSTDRKSTRLN